MKNSNDAIGNRTRDLPACSAVPQPTAPSASEANVTESKGRGRSMTSLRRHRGEVEVSLIPICNPAWEGGEWSTPRAGRFNPGKEKRQRFYGKLFGPRSRSGRHGESHRIGIRSLDRTACSEMLNRIRYPGHQWTRKQAKCIPAMRKWRWQTLSRYCLPYWYW
jgi:hypothetical protein